MAEDALKTKFDSTLFELYELGEAKTPFGPIKKTNKKKKQSYKPGIRYRLPFLLGLYISLGVTVPWMMAAFWLALTFVMLQNHGIEWKVISLVALGVMVILLLLSLCFRTTYPHSMLHEHIAATHGQKDRSAPEIHKSS
jgi:hypothetical protein